ncbi:MAG: ribonuclease G [Gammaproteobacteria bacterium]|nr:ribonuclease G [Gammaproteobacteria bacterium]
MRAKEILVNVSPREVRAAVVENGVVQEVYIERASHRGLIGNIYKGKASRVLPGMQAAFIDLGLVRTGFLHVSNIANSRQDNEGTEADDIRDLVSEGQELLVQVLKDPLGSKGARLTTFVTFPSRYLVYLPRGNGIGISTRIEDEDEKQRLKDLLATMTDDQQKGGFIVRTAAEGADFDALRADMMFLLRLWEIVEKNYASMPAGEIVHADLDLPLRILRDLLGDDMERIRVDSAGDLVEMKEFATTFIPELAPRIEEYTDERPIFDLYGIEDEIHRALGRTVPLKSGGYLVIDQTEAMTTIDINTGGYVGHRNLEETIFRTNLEATVAIARQLRLRNLGGIIILDFIDMDEPEHRSQVLQALEKSLARDHARNNISVISELGLVEMTRKRVRESLEHVLCYACPSCDGRGFLKTPETICYEIFREILRQNRQFDFQELLVLAYPEVIELLVDEESASLAELEELTGKPIRLQSESLYAQDQFDVMLM